MLRRSARSRRYRADSRWTPRKLGTDLIAYWLPSHPTSTVSNIPNLGGNPAWDLLQATGSFQGTLVAGPTGYNVLRTDGVDDRYRAVVAGFARPFELRIVGRFLVTTGSKFLADGVDDVSGTLELVSATSCRSSWGGAAGTLTSQPDMTIFRMWMTRGDSPNLVSLDGVSITQAAGTDNPGGLTIGVRGSQALGFGNCEYAAIALTRVLSASNALKLERFMWPYGNAKGVLVAEGDSLTAGGTQGATPWPSLLSASVTDAYQIINRAVAGDQLVLDIIPEFATDILPRIAPARVKRPIFVLWAGTNDKAIGGRTDAQISADIFNVCDQARAAGAYVVCVNMLPRTTIDFANLNALIAAGSSHYDVLVDVSAFPNWVAQPTWWVGAPVDQIHLSTIGEQEFATNYLEPAIASLL